ncbi:MAG: hypothetical protein JW724_01050 [Candidatus Altiarchaeota archaeon]|nr:hypothetical protein [Candidatus Altiarchaeota archaeon]
MRNTFPLVILLLCITLNATALDNETATLHGQEAGILKVRSVEMVIDQNGMVSVTENLVVRAGDVVRRMIPGKVRDISVTDSKGNSIPAYESAHENEYQLIGFFIEESDNTEENIAIKYNTQHLTAKSGDVWGISFSGSFTAQSTILKVYFPPNSEIVSIEPGDLYRTNVKPNEIWFYPQDELLSLSCQYKVTADKLPTTTLPESTGTDYSIALIIIAVLAFFLVLLIFYVFNNRRSGLADTFKPSNIPAPAEKAVELADVKEPPASPAKETPKKGRIKDSVLNMLDANEKMVLELMKTAEDEITQAYVYKSTGIPKSTLSDVIKRLEKRNIIERNREGRTNWIKLKEWVFD